MEREGWQEARPLPRPTPFCHYIVWDEIGILGLDVVFLLMRGDDDYVAECHTLGLKPRAHRFHVRVERLPSK